MVVAIRWFDVDFSNSEALELIFGFEVDSGECDVKSTAIQFVSSHLFDDFGWCRRMKSQDRIRLLVEIFNDRDGCCLRFDPS